MAETSLAKWTKLSNMWMEDNGREVSSFWFSYLYKPEKLKFSKRSILFISEICIICFAVDIMASPKKVEKECVLQQGLIEFITCKPFIKHGTKRNLSFLNIVDSNQVIFIHRPSKYGIMLRLWLIKPFIGSYYSVLCLFI